MVILTQSRGGTQRSFAEPKPQQMSALPFPVLVGSWTALKPIVRAFLNLTAERPKERLKPAAITLFAAASPTADVMAAPYKQGKPKVVNPTAMAL